MLTFGSTGIASQLLLVLDMTDSALEQFEALRAGSPFGIRFHLTALIVQAGGLTVLEGQESVHIPAKIWEAALESAQRAETVTILLRHRIEGSAEWTRSIQAIRTAQVAMAEHRYADAIREARVALEQLGRMAHVDFETTPKPDRTKEQRLAAVRKAVMDLASAAHHSDTVTAEITWRRPDAVAVVSLVASLLVELSSD